MASLRKHKGNVWFKIRHYTRTFIPGGRHGPVQTEFRQGLDRASVKRGFLFGRDKHNCFVYIQPATDVEVITHRLCLY